jgi:hypothetical protein
MSDEELRIRETLAADKRQPGELHDAAIRRAMRATAAQLAASAAPPRLRRSFLPAGIAAGFVLVIGGALFLRHLPPPGDDVMRGAETPSSALLPAANAELAVPPSEFRWPAQAGATAYLLTLRDDAGSVLWRSEPGAATTLAIPADVRGRLVSGHSYLWGVSVSGLVDVNELGPYVFRVR